MVDLTLLVTEETEKGKVSEMIKELTVLSDASLIEKPVSAEIVAGFDPCDVLPPYNIKEVQAALKQLEDTTKVSNYQVFAFEVKNTGVFDVLSSFCEKYQARALGVEIA